MADTNEVESKALSDQELVTTYKDLGGVGRGFRFLKDLLFLASSVTVSKPERIIALLHVQTSTASLTIVLRLK